MIFWRIFKDLTLPQIQKIAYFETFGNLQKKKTSLTNN